MLGVREFRMIRQHPHMIIENLDKSAVDFQNLLPAAAPICERAFAQRTQQRRVSGKHAHIPVLARQLRFGHLLIDKQPLGRRDFELKRVRHLGLSLHLLRRFEHVFDRSLHIERLLRKSIVLSIDNFLEAAHRIFELHVLAWTSRKLFGHVEGLR